MLQRKRIYPLLAGKVQRAKHALHVFERLIALRQPEAQFARFAKAFHDNVHFLFDLRPVVDVHQFQPVCRCIDVQAAGDGREQWHHLLFTVSVEDQKHPVDMREQFGCLAQHPQRLALVVNSMIVQLEQGSVTRVGHHQHQFLRVACALQVFQHGDSGNTHDEVVGEQEDVGGVDQRQLTIRLDKVINAEQRSQHQTDQAKNIAVAQRRQHRPSEKELCRQVRIQEI